MEGAINVDSSEFVDYLVASITGMAGLTNILRQALDFYLTTKCRSWYVMQIPYDVAEEYDVLPERVKEQEEEADKLRDEMVRKYLGRSWRQLQQKYEEARKLVKPKDITDTVQRHEMDIALKAIYDRERSLIRKVEEFVDICKLLSMPKNQIRVRSGQYIEREVNARTEHDMIGERARELMALPKYTVYVRKLEGARSAGIYRTTTKALQEGTADMSDIDIMMKRTRENWCKERYDIRDEIYNREMPVSEDREPPPLWG